MAGWVSLRSSRPRAFLGAFGSRTVHGSWLVGWFPPAAALLRCTHPSRWGGSRGLFTGGGGASVVQLTLQDIARSLRDRQHKRVLVMAGAGISTPSGIPDFRSPGSGLYDNLQQYDLPYAEAIFEIGFFHRNPAPFFALAKELYPGNYRPNPTHFFVHLLHQKGQLLRMYTQNIDGLERLAGIPPEKLVEAHGTFATATCTSCLQKYKGEELRPAVMSGSVPKCSACGGVVKPDIVFFGEELPPRFLKYLTDFPLADLLIIMGTSLEVRKRMNQQVPAFAAARPTGGALCQFGRSRAQLCAPPAHQQGPCGAVCVGAAPSGRLAAGGGGGWRAGAGGGSGLDPGAAGADGGRR